MNIPLGIGIFLGIFTLMMMLMHFSYRMIYNNALERAQRTLMRRFENTFKELPAPGGVLRIEYNQARELLQLTGKDCARAVAQLKYEPLHREVANLWLYR